MVSIENQRTRMIDKHLKGRGIRDRAVLQAMAEVPREAFLPDEMREAAYQDAPLPIGEGQTISQPYIVAVMTQLLEPRRTDRVLEVGTGSGYAAAVLSRIVEMVYTLERHASLARSAQAVFDRLGYDNIHVREGDGTLGWPEESPFEAIVVTAGACGVPEPLKRQLAIGGRLVIPVGSREVQKLRHIRRTGEDRYEEERHLAVRFVPLVGSPGRP
jgi:protein-L-isoaspartate(D-aspartate) O-methyltransferase